MKNPSKTEEFIPDGGKGGCPGLALTPLAGVVVTLSVLGYAAYRGAVEILALVG